MDFRPVASIVGAMMVVLAGAMGVTALISLVDQGNSDWQAFATSAAITLFIGVAFLLINQEKRSNLSLRQAFVMTVAIWLTIAIFGALPFLFGDLEMSLADAFFESMSGVTTTGSTVMSDLDNSPRGILLWRALLQWLGGVGIIVMAVSFLPMLQVGGMQLFKTEAFDQSEKILPRAAEISVAILTIYCVLTTVGAILLWFAGMGAFDSVVHAMTSLATGGFSSHDASVGYFNSAWVDWTIVLLMIIGSLPFAVFLIALRNGIKPFFEDGQITTFLVLLAVAVSAMVLWLTWNQDMAPIAAIRYATFNVTSIMTGTGYSTADYSLWGGFAVTLMFIVMFIGGCAGSTSCGIKIFRFQVLFATARVQMNRLIHPNGVFIPHYNGKPMPDDVPTSVMGFFCLFISTFAVLALILGACGLDLVTAITASATAVANVGPGLGEIVGPSGNFQSLPDSAKWAMAIGMLLGRLELFSVLVLCIPSFWRN
jgi:trk system potassium uptake protein TrkH